MTTASARAGQSRKRTRIQQKNEQRILSAAVEVFSSYGFRGTTIDEIAAQSGMSKPNLLYYYKSKEAIYTAALEHTLEIWLEPLTRLDPAGDPAEEIWAYIEHKLEMSRQAPAASRLFANEIMHGAGAIETYLKTTLKDLVAEKCTILQNWIDQGRLAPIAPLHLIFMIWATTQHYADFEVQIDVLDETSREERFEVAQQTLKTIFLRGILAAG